MTADILAAAPDSPAARLQSAPGEFDFLQAVDLLEQLARMRGLPTVPLGRGCDPSREAVSLRAPFEFAFRPLPVQQMTAGPGGQPRLDVNFLGLSSSDGPLPEPYVDLVRASLLARDESPVDFLGIFQHRLLSYAYRAADVARGAAPFSQAGRGPLAPALRALAGLPGTDDEEGALPANLPAAVQARRSLHGLCILLGRCFGMRVAGREAAGRWLDLPPALRSVPGKTGRNRLLGRGAILGRRAWQPDGAVELDFGTLPAPLFRALLPGGARHADLVRLCAWYLGPDLECRIRMACLPGRRTCTLDADCRLGQAAWLGSAGAVHAVRFTLARDGAPEDAE